MFRTRKQLNRKSTGLRKRRPPSCCALRNPLQSDIYDRDIEQYNDTAEADYECSQFRTAAFEPFRVDDRFPTV
jgi:hypothetical protein